MRTNNGTAIKISHLSAATKSAAKHQSSNQSIMVYIAPHITSKSMINFHNMLTASIHYLN